MTKKGKMKISKLKRNNHTTNKMKKQGKLKLQRHRQKVQKQRPPDPTPPADSDTEGSASGEEWADMLDDAERDYMERRLAQQPQLLADVPKDDEQAQQSSKPRKRTRVKPPVHKGHSDSGAESDALTDSEAEVETRYEDDLAAHPKKKLKQLLPIKTKEGLQMRTQECEESESEHEEDQPPAKKQKQLEDPEPEGSDSGLEGTGDDETNIEETLIGDGETINAVQLAVARRERLNKDKLRIGALCSSLLESPEKKLKNFYPILFLMEDKLKDGSENLHSIRKLASLSAYEVFKDILPDYSIKHQDYSNIKLKKDTLTLYKYEKELLEFYKRYLQRLERAMAVLRPKKGDRRKPEESSLSLALVSVRCMCGLLVARPYFNYATNIAQSVVPLLDHRDSEIRKVVSECCTAVFQEDSKGEITLALVRLINQLVKRRADRLQPHALDCLLDLNIKDVSLDEEADLKYKQKKEEKHKKRIINLSKKEKKRKKKLREVERELLETQAQESATLRGKHLAEVTRTLFHIYFRVLKAAPHSALLAAALVGLAKFTHAINLEYYTDLVAILARLLEDPGVRDRERMLCVRAALAVLAGRGDALNVDPARFHARLYVSMLDVHAGKTVEDLKIVLESVLEVVSRSRRVSAAVLQAYGKRLCTLALQLPHNGALAALVTLHRMAQQSKAVQSLLESGEEAGSGRYDPQSPTPEHCGAHAAATHELCLLARHYHPHVRAAASLALPADVAKLHPLQILEDYDGSKLSFKPAVPPPRQGTTPKHKATHTHTWMQTELREMCLRVEENVPDKGDFTKLFNR